MIPPPERSPDRDAAIDALLSRVPTHGWTIPEHADPLFPGGAPDLIEAFCDLSDRRMEQEPLDPDLRLPARVRALIASRLARNRPHKDAIRRALAILALPSNLPRAARITARTVDTIWHAAGDRAADFSWYTKRATLTGVYASTLLFWLRDDSEDDAATLAFLDRRLAGVARIGKIRRQVKEKIVLS